MFLNSEFQNTIKNPSLSKDIDITQIEFQEVECTPFKWSHIEGSPSAKSLLEKNYWVIDQGFRSSHLEVLCKIGIPKVFTNFTGKHLHQSLV